jgi:hypothetical protein
MTQTQWLPGIVALAIGLAIGLILLMRLRGTASRAARQQSGQLDDLDRRAELLIEQLKELSSDRHHLEPEQFEAEKRRLELEAAAALRARDELARGAATAPSKATTGVEQEPAPAPTGWLAAHPQLKGALWGGAVVLFFVALGLLLGQEQKPRQDGGAPTGSTPPMAGAGEAQESDPALKEALARFEVHPDSLAAMARLAHELINHQDFDEASRLTERALGLDPFHVESRIHRALLLALRGDRQKGEKELERLASIYPDAYEGRLYLGLLALQSGEQRSALEHLERYAAEAPANEQPPQLAAGIATLRKQLGMAAPRTPTR